MEGPNSTTTRTSYCSISRPTERHFESDGFQQVLLSSTCPKNAGGRVKKDLCRLPVFATTLLELKSILAKYYRMKRFCSHLDMKKFRSDQQVFMNL
jgi:hypothetical protein